MVEELRPAEKGLKEPLTIKKRPKYYDHSATITNSLPGPINSIETENPLYNREEISKNRRDENAPFVWVVNDGNDDLFVRTSSTSDFEDFSDENVLHPNDVKVYYNVFELRLRSPTLGLLYRVAEFEITPCCTGGDGTVQVSGQPVTISGNVVNISGQTVIAVISGLNVNVSGSIVQISGQAVVTDSGSVTSVSGNIVQIENVSGQTVNVSISGLSVNISGSIILISGQIVQISGQAVVTDSGSVTSVSGNIVEIASGAFVQISGQTIVAVISGLSVNVSGAIVQISGQAVDISGALVQISGQAVVTDSGSVTSISGNIVEITSGAFVQISGQSVSATLSLAPATRVTIHNTSLPVIGSSLIGGPLTPNNPPCGFRTEVGISVTGQLNAVIINSGDAQTLLLSAGIGLNPSALYIYDVILHSGDTMDLNYTVSSGTIQVIRIDEINAMVI